MTDSLKSEPEKLQSFVNKARNILAIVVAPFSAFYSNFRVNYRILTNECQTPWIATVLLIIVVLPLFFISWARVHKNTSAQETIAPKKHSAIVRALQLIGAACYSAIVTSSLALGVYTFLQGVGTAAQMVPILGGIIIGVLSVVQLLNAHNIISSGWQPKKLKDDFLALWRENLKNRCAKNLLKNLGGVFGHVLSIGVALLLGVGIAFAFTFFGLPGMIVAGVIGGAILLVEFNSFLPTFYKNITNNLNYLYEDLKYIFGIRKTPPISAAHLEVEALLQKMLERDITPSEQAQLKTAQQKASAESSWNNARVLRYTLYGIILAVTIWGSIMSLGLLPGALGIVAACIMACSGVAGFTSTIKNIAKRFLSPEKSTPVDPTTNTPCTPGFTPCHTMHQIAPVDSTAIIIRPFKPQQKPEPINKLFI